MLNKILETINKGYDVVFRPDYIFEDRNKFFMQLRKNSRTIEHEFNLGELQKLPMVSEYYISETLDLMVKDMEDVIIMERKRRHDQT